MNNGIIHIGNYLFETLLAISNKEQEVGLMYVEPPAPIMTFIYNKPQINKFWMKNTKAPLDIVFCSNGQVSQICLGEPYSTSVIGDNRFSDLVIEFPRGTVVSSDIKLGHHVGVVKPTVAELKKLIVEKTGSIL